VNPLWTLAPVSLLLGGATMWIFRRNRRCCGDRRDRPAHSGLSSGVLALRGRAITRLEVVGGGCSLQTRDSIACWSSAPGDSDSDDAGLLSSGRGLMGLRRYRSAVRALVTLAMHQPLDAITPELSLRTASPSKAPACAVVSERTGELANTARAAGVRRYAVERGRSASSEDNGRGRGFSLSRTPRVREGYSTGLAIPPAPLLPAGPVDWIEISYPPAVLEFIGSRRTGPYGSASFP
jgi:hypothetical protein